MAFSFSERLEMLRQKQSAVLELENKIDESWCNGVFERYLFPVLTPEHIPLTWRYDLNPQRNPFLMERMGINAVFNAGAMLWNGNIILAARIEGADRKSFFAIAESPTGIDHFKFWDDPVIMPETDNPDTNIYDVRLTKHEDGLIYGDLYRAMTQMLRR
jgi:4-O-beta-D-mannosyl-D-glucose phosphorylase